MSKINSKAQLKKQLEGVRNRGILKFLIIRKYLGGGKCKRNG